MAISAYGSIDGVFCRLWFDWWRLLPVVWLYGRFCQNDWLMGFWLMCFIPRSDDFCQDTDRWALSPRNNYFTINWDVILGRMPIIGLIIGSYPHQLVWLLGHMPIIGLIIGSYPRQWFVYWVISPVSGLIIGLIPFSGWINGCYLFSGWINGCYPFSGWINGLFPPSSCLIMGLFPCSGLINGLPPLQYHD